VNSYLGGEVELKTKKERTPLKFVSHATFLLPKAKILPLTNGPKKRRMMKRRIRFEFYLAFLLSLGLTTLTQTWTRMFNLYMQYPNP
jgi:hypothetical protein